MTQDELADCAYVSADTIKRIESWKSVKLDVAFNLAELLNVAIQSLLPQQDIQQKNELTEKIKDAQDTLQLVLDKLQNK